MKIALLKCKNIPPTAFPPSVLLVILLKKRNSPCLLGLCPLKVARGDSLLLLTSGPCLVNGGTSGHRPTGLADRPLQGCPVQCLGALAVRRLREDLRCPEQRIQPGLEAGARSPGSSPSSDSCTSLHLAKPQCPHLERGGKPPTLQSGWKGSSPPHMLRLQRPSPTHPT